MMRLLAVSLALTLAAYAQAPAARTFLYVLDCGGILHKFDAATGKPIARTDLSQKTNLIPSHGDIAGSTIEGCAANGAVYSEATNTFATLSPTTGSADERGQQRYRLLRFHLPELELDSSIALPGSYEDMPGLEAAADGSLRVTTEKQTFELSQGKFILDRTPADAVIPHAHRIEPGLPMFEFDLNGLDASRLDFSLPGIKLQATPLERSGRSFLIQYARPGQNFAFAVLDEAAKRITTLSPGFTTTPNNIHLAPGGTAVIAQEAAFIGSMQVAQTTAHLALVDAATGKPVREWTDAAAAHGTSLAVTPEGFLVVSANDRYRFLSLGKTFPATPVLILQGQTKSGIFYANR